MTTESRAPGGGIYRFAGCVLDVARRELRRHGKAVTTQPRVFDLLAYLEAGGDPKHAVFKK